MLHCVFAKKNIPVADTDHSWEVEIEVESQIPHTIQCVA